MRLLLDTHVLIWSVGQSDRLNAAARAMLEDPGNEVLFSAVSIWEIAIKAGRGRPDFEMDPSDILATALQQGFLEVPVRASVAATVGTLAAVHRDPFDRLLVAQAITEPARLLTADSALAPYSELVTLIA